MFFEILIVVILTLINGVLAMSELAIVSSRAARLKVLADGGNKSAALAMRLAKDPGKFLSSVQIGITLVGILSGAFSGATLGLRITDALISFGISTAVAEALGVGGIVVVITYLSLIFGELVPKQIALRSPESVAVRISGLLFGISVLAAPLVWLLDKSGKLVLKVLGQSSEIDRGMTDEEVKVVLAEAQTAGVMEEAETEMIEGVMRIADRTARGLMIPRQDVELVDISDSVEEAIHRFKDTRRSRLPVRDGDMDNIVGVISSRDFLDREAGNADINIRDMLIDVPVVGDKMAALDVISALRKSPAHMVLVYDEHGHFEGIITPMDVLEIITGEFLDETDQEQKYILRDDGSYLVSGWMPIDEFSEQLNFPIDEDRDYETVAGLVLDKMGHLPKAGDQIVIGKLKIEVVDMDGRRIDKLIITS